MRLRFARALASLLALAALLGVGACSKGSEGKIRVAYVTNGSVSFWTIAAAGARKAGQDLGVEVDVRMPKDPTEQQRVIEELLSLSIDGIALSPIDGKNQMELIDDACGRTHFILHDSDAPGTKRRSVR